jgi:hypothetical protein
METILDLIEIKVCGVGEIVRKEDIKSNEDADNISEQEKE